jgi:hypothetical protein
MELKHMLEKITVSILSGLCRFSLFIQIFNIRLFKYGNWLFDYRFLEVSN